MNNQFNLLGTGAYQPKTVITSSHIDEMMGYPQGHTEKTTAVRTRHYAMNETATEMAAHAVTQALEKAKLSINDIDCIIAASGTMEQAIPCNAALLHGAMKPIKPIPAFDINMTCLGSLNAIQLASTMLNAGQYNTILVYASDIASVGVDWSNIKVAGIFGDGAAALILSRHQASRSQRIIASLFETHSEGKDYCKIIGYGTKHHPSKSLENYSEKCQFQMQGKEVYKLAASLLPSFANKLLQQAHLTMDDIDWVVPHQASPSGLKHIQKKLGISPDKHINIVADIGNQISASILTGLNYLLSNRPVKQGDKVLLIGTGAGLSMGGIILEY